MRHGTRKTPVAPGPGLDCPKGAWQPPGEMTQTTQPPSSSHPPEVSPATDEAVPSGASSRSESAELQRAHQALARSQAMLRMAGRVAHFGAWSYDAVAQTLDWSEEVYAIHEAPATFVPNVADAIAFYEPESRPTIEAAFARCVAEGTPFDLELQIRTLRGRVLWVRAAGEAVHDGGGRIVRVEGAFQDIHEWVATRERARRVADELVETLESMSDAFFLLDGAWCFRYINRQAGRLLLRGAEELIGKNIWEEFRPAVGSRFHQEYERVARTGQATTFEALYAPLGRWFEVHAQAARGGVAVYFRDISATRDAKLQLQMQAELIEQTQDAIIVSDLEGRVTFWNGSAERIYGLKRDHVAGRNLGEIVHKVPSVFAQALADTLAKGTWQGEVAHVTAQQAALTVASRWNLLRDADGQPKAIMVSNTDVTERRRVEHQYLRAQRMESIGTLAGGVAHDLNNVLAPIMMAADLLRANDLDRESQGLVELIANSARRGADMVGQVLSFARGVDGARMVVQVSHLVTDILRLAAETFPKAIRCESELPELLWPIQGDPTQLHQVLLNLCLNSRDAMPNGGRLRIAAVNVELDASYAAMNIDAREGAYIRLDIEDNGHGIAPEIVDKIFDPFFTTKEIGKGTGLGLATSLAIIKSHGGFIRVYSDVGLGTRFNVYLPAERGLSTEASDAGAAFLPRGEGELILVVDDEVAIRQITRHTLEAFGYRVLLASDGSEAVALFAERGRDIAVVLTDMMMPVMDGIATIHVLRRLDPQVRIIAASGISANGHVARAIEAGVTDFLPKPYTAEALLQALRKAIAA